MTELWRRDVGIDVAQKDCQKIMKTRFVYQSSQRRELVGMDRASLGNEHAYSREPGRFGTTENNNNTTNTDNNININDQDWHQGMEPHLQARDLPQWDFG